MTRYEIEIMESLQHLLKEIAEQVKVIAKAIGASQKDGQPAIAPNEPILGNFDAEGK